MAILASSVCLALDTPRLDPASRLAEVLKQLNLFFTVFFVGEMLTKIAALGFGRYIRSGWNQVATRAVGVTRGARWPWSLSLPPSQADT